jgi:hypothetical protein
MLGLLMTKQAKQQEWRTILTTAQNNEFPKHIIHNLKGKTPNNTTEQEVINIYIPQFTNMKSYKPLQAD